MFLIERVVTLHSTSCVISSPTSIWIYNGISITSYVCVFFWIIHYLYIIHDMRLTRNSRALWICQSDIQPKMIFKLNHDFFLCSVRTFGQCTENKHIHVACTNVMVIWNSMEDLGDYFRPFFMVSSRQNIICGRFDHCSIYVWHLRAWWHEQRQLWLSLSPKYFREKTLEVLFLSVYWHNDKKWSHHLDKD